MSHFVRTSYSLNASLIAFTSSSFTYPSLPSYLPVASCLCLTASSHFRRSVSSSKGRNPTHHPSKITALIFGSSCLLTTSHEDSGTRSPCPAKADLSYCGIAVGRLRRRDSNTFWPRGRSWVDGWPRCWIRGLSGCAFASATWSAWVR